MRVIMTCGGTGGHIYPAVAIADEIKKRDPNAQILFVGSKLGLEQRLVPESGYEIELITADGFSRKSLIRNIKLMKKLREGRKRSMEILEEFSADVVIGTGGYASVPLMKAAQKMGIPTYIHEQNAIPGMANKLFEKKVKKLFLGFEAASEHFKYPAKHIYAGNPVRKEFSMISREEARAALGFSKDDFVLLAFGGSQGAGRINKAVMKIIETFNGVKDFHICLSTGDYYYEAICNELNDKGIGIADNIRIMEYIREMAKYLSASDLIISRSGALSVAEATMCGKPSIFIPFPMATGNHQYFNAKAVEDKGGALIIEEKDLDNDDLMSAVLRLKNNKELLNQMAEKSFACAPVNAAGIICDNIEEFNR